MLNSMIDSADNESAFYIQPRYGKTSSPSDAVYRKQARYKRFPERSGVEDGRRRLEAKATIAEMGSSALIKA